MSKDFRPALPHDDLMEVLPDLFIVRSTYQFMPGFTIPRNMVVARQGGELTLINGVRLSQEGEAALARLGTVRHLVRLGRAHGADDPYLIHRYKPTTWAPAALQAEHELKALAAPVGEALCFERGLTPEATLLLGETLITCDSFQNWTPATLEKSSWFGRIFMKRMGFRPALIGPLWLKRIGHEVEADFRRIAERSFRHVLSGHGDPLMDTAHAAFTEEIERTFVGRQAKEGRKRGR